MEDLADRSMDDESQFWMALHDTISVEQASSVSQSEVALCRFIATASVYLHDFLSDAENLTHAIELLIFSPLFMYHDEHMTDILAGYIRNETNKNSLFITLMVVVTLCVGQDDFFRRPDRTSTTSGKRFSMGHLSKIMFRSLRKQWRDVMPPLIKLVEDVGVIEASSNHHTAIGIASPQGGWELRLGTVSMSALYQVCRSHKLLSEELDLFTNAFVMHLFTVVERTRDAIDETFNYNTIKLIIALNEQFMVSNLNYKMETRKLYNGLPPPLQPDIVHRDRNGRAKRRSRDENPVLDILKDTRFDSRTFGENLIFILNRSGHDDPEALCVSLLILKMLFIIFISDDTPEFFYTNDLCVLVDVFVREISDLGDDCINLKHTYLRVLYPLLTRSQLRYHPYKRKEIREMLLNEEAYSQVDSTTKRLVERNLNASWCVELQEKELKDQNKPKRPTRRTDDSSTSMLSDKLAVITLEEPSKADSRMVELKKKEPSYTTSNSGNLLQKQGHDSNPQFLDVKRVASAASVMENAHEHTSKNNQHGFMKRRRPPPPPAHSKASSLRSASSSTTSVNSVTPSTNSDYSSYTSTKHCFRTLRRPAPKPPIKE